MVEAVCSGVMNLYRTVKWAPSYGGKNLWYGVGRAFSLKKAEL